MEDDDGSFGGETQCRKNMTGLWKRAAWWDRKGAEVAGGGVPM